MAKHLPRDFGHPVVFLPSFNEVATIGPNIRPNDYSGTDDGVLADSFLDKGR